MEKGIYASVVDHISTQFVRTIPIPRLKPGKEKEIVSKVREAEERRAWANRTLENNMNKFENIIKRSYGY